MLFLNSRPCFGKHTRVFANALSGQVAQAAAEKLAVLVKPMDGGKKKENGYSAQDFHYDQRAGTVSCPQKQQLDFSRETLQKGQVVKQYRCHVKEAALSVVWNPAGDFLLSWLSRLRIFLTLVHLLFLVHPVLGQHS